MNVKNVILVAAAMLLALGLSAQEAQQSNRGQRHGMMTHQGPKKPQQFKKQHAAGIPGLTAEQRKSMKDLRIAMNKEVRKNSNLLREKKARLITLQGEDKPDQKAINSTIDEIVVLQGKNMKARADFQLKVKAMLNDEQREAYHRITAKAHKKAPKKASVAKRSDG